MANKQQTAVEWFADKIDYLIPFVSDEHAKYFNSLIEQAKEMEKERTINFTEDWYFNGFPLEDGGVGVEETIEKHYNETYGGGEQ